MAGFDDEVFGAPPVKPPVHAIGQPIDDLSAPELAERIAVLKPRSSGSSWPLSSAKRRATPPPLFSNLERQSSRRGTRRRRPGDTNELLTIIIYE